MPATNTTTRSALSGLIPAAVSRLIIQDMQRVSATSNGFGLERMAASSESTVSLDDSFEPEWVAEDFGEKPTAALTARGATLKAEELATILIISDNTLRDAGGDIVAAIRRLAPAAFMRKMDKTILYGGSAGYAKPATFPLGIVPSAIAAGNTITSGAVPADDLAAEISNTMALVEADGYDVNLMMAGSSLKAALRGLRDQNGGLLFQPSLQAGTPASLYGEDLLYIDKKAFNTNTNTGARLILGDRTTVRAAIWENMAYRISQEATVVDDDGNVFSAFQRDATFVRITMRLGWQIYKLTDDATDYPFAVLRNAGAV